MFCAWTQQFYSPLPPVWGPLPTRQEELPFDRRIRPISSAASRQHLGFYNQREKEKKKKKKKKNPELFFKCSGSWQTPKCLLPNAFSLNFQTSGVFPEQSNPSASDSFTLNSLGGCCVRSGLTSPRSPGEGFFFPFESEGGILPTGHGTQTPKEWKAWLETPSPQDENQVLFCPNHHSLCPVLPIRLSP